MPKRFVVDTNVPIVANGRPDSSDGGSIPNPKCRLAAVEFLEQLRKRWIVVVDAAGEIQREYSNQLNPRGQPGVGDRFYQEILNSSPKRVRRIALTKRIDGSYSDFPTSVALTTFHDDDRKFAALARHEGIPVVNATDSDWLDHRAALSIEEIDVKFVCGCDRVKWFE